MFINVRGQLRLVDCSWLPKFACSDGKVGSKAILTLGEQKYRNRKSKINDSNKLRALNIWLHIPHVQN